MSLSPSKREEQYKFRLKVLELVKEHGFVTRRFCSDQLAMDANTMGGRLGSMVRDGLLLRRDGVRDFMNNMNFEYISTGKVPSLKESRPAPAVIKKPFDAPGTVALWGVWPVSFHPPRMKPRVVNELRG